MTWKKVFLGLLILVFAGSTLISQDAAKYIMYSDQRKSWGTGFLWSSCVLPGAGHFYASDVGNGFLFLGLTLGSAVLAISGTQTSTDAYGWEETKITKPAQFWLGFGALLVVRVIEWIDIDRAVDKYNAALRRKLGIEEGTGLSFDFMPRLVGNTMPDPGVSVTEGYFSFGLSRSF